MSGAHLLRAVIALPPGQSLESWDGVRFEGGTLFFSGGQHGVEVASITSDGIRTPDPAGTDLFSLLVRAREHAQPWPPQRGSLPSEGHAMGRPRLPNRAVWQQP